MVKLAVVILNWNGKRFLETFLLPLIKSLPAYAEVVVADNNSTDDSLKFMQRNYPSIRVIENPSNQGFAEGYNTALKQVDAEFYCLLNSDIEVSEHWIEPIVECFEQNPDVAVIQPKLLSYSEKDMFEYAGASGGFIDKYGFPFCRGRVFGVLEKDLGQYDSPMDVFWATGAAMFVRSEVYHRLGGLDSDFFAHMEEIDFCWRVKNQGYRICVVPQSIVYHVGGGTLPKNNSLKTYLNFRNNLYLLQKNLPQNRVFITFFVKFFLDQIAAVYFLLQGNRKDFTAVYRAMFHFWKNRKQMKQKRDVISEQTFAQTYPKSIVWAHYFLRKKYFDGKKLF